MRKMKDSEIEWIGEIPESWATKKLSYYFKKIGSGTTPDTANGYFYDGDYNWLQTGDLTDGYITSTSKRITQEAVDAYSALTFFKKGAVVIAMYGATIGKLGILDIDCFTNQACCALSEPKEANSKFVYYWLLCNRENIVRLSLGGGQPNISQGIITSLKVPAPTSVEEQTRIVTYLDKECAKIDAIITAKEKTNELLKERRQSIIYEAVTKGLDPTVPMKDSGIEWIGEIPTHWNTMRLRSKFSFGKGLPITKADLRDSGVSVVSYGQIHSKHNIGTTIKTELIRYVDNVYLDTNASSLVNNGDFIFADTSEDLSGCGNCVYVDTNYPLFAGYHTMILRPIENTSSKYYSYLFATDAWRSQIRAQASGVKLFSITQKMLRDALLIEPSEEEKASIVSFLDDMCSTTNTIIASNEATIEKLKEYRQSVIYEAVTGKVEI